MSKEKLRDPAAVAIGKRVRTARQARSLTIEQLAEAAETSSQFLSQIERGEQQMTVGKFGRLAKALGVSCDYLIYGVSASNDRAALAADYLAGMNCVERDLVSRTIIGLRGLLDEVAPEQ